MGANFPESHRISGSWSRASPSPFLNGEFDGVSHPVAGRCLAHWTAQSSFGDGDQFYGTHEMTLTMPNLKPKVRFFEVAQSKS